MLVTPSCYCYKVYSLNMEFNVEFYLQTSTTGVALFRNSFGKTSLFLFYFIFFYFFFLKIWFFFFLRRGQFHSYPSPSSWDAYCDHSWLLILLILSWIIFLYAVMFRYEDSEIGSVCPYLEKKNHFSSKHMGPNS